MGRDKALLAIDGVPMVLRVAEALRAAGAREVVAVGGAAEVAALGVRQVADEMPGEGPLGGILTALAALPDDVVLVVSCDLLAPSPAAMAATVAGLTVDSDVAVPALLDGPPQWLHAAWWRGAQGPIRRCYEQGDRAIHLAVHSAGLRVARLDDVDPAALADADSPSDLPRK